MAYNKYKDLSGRTAPDKVSRDEAFSIASNPKYDGYQKSLASMVCQFLDKNREILLHLLITQEQKQNLVLNLILILKINNQHKSSTNQL